MQRKIIFDTVRRLLGRGFSRREVIALDAAIAGMFGIAVIIAKSLLH